MAVDGGAGLGLTGFTFHIQPDRLTVHLEIPPGGPAGAEEPALELLKDELGQRRIVFGFDDVRLGRALAEIRRALSTGSGGRIVLAEGQLTVPGANGRIEYRVGRGALNPDPAAADLVRPGQVLALRTAAEPGTPGRDVFGEEIAAIPGYDPPLDAGDNVRRSEDGLSYLAEIYGRATVAGGLVSVAGLVEVAEDRMSAWVPIYPRMADNSRLECEDLVRSLQAAGVVHGIMEEAIRAALEQEVVLPRFLAAKGEPPQPGRDAVLRFNFTLNDADPQQVEALRRAGEVDPAALRRSLLVAGEVLAKKIPPVAPVPGRQVTGEELAGDEPLDIPLAAGENVVVTGDGPILAVADTLAAGYADYQAGVVSVSDPLRVSDDAMQAVMDIHPPDRQGRGLGGKLLLKMLAAHQITHGVRKETIRRAVEYAAAKGRVLNEVVVARGREPVDGRDARIELMVQPGIRAGRISQPTENIDFRERDAILSVKKGDLLARRIPPEPGEDGWTVRGVPLSAKPGADIQFQPQPNVVVSEDGLSLLSDLDGMVTVLGGNKIAVFQVYEVKGDVDYRVGNLDMAGSLVISGWVRPGFIVKASGEIRVGGGVEDALLLAGAGVVISGGMISRGQGRLRTGGDLSVRFLEWTKVYADGNIFVQDQIMRSQVFSCGTLIVTAGRGWIRGGTVAAIQGIEAKEIGSPAGLRTVVMAGSNPYLRHRMRQLDRQLVDFTRQRSKMDTVLGRSLAQHRQGELAPDIRRKLSLLTKRRRALVQAGDRLVRPRQELARQLAAIDLRNISIRAQQSVYAGTVVVLGRVRHRVREDLTRPVTFRLDEECREINIE